MPQVQLSVLLQLKDMLSGGLGKVRGSLSQLEQRLSAGQKEAAAFNEKWGATMRLGQQVGAGMTAAGAGIMVVARSGVQASMELEGYRAKLEVAMKDATKAAEMYDWAKKKAASTPFEMSDVVDATTRLEMYGLSATEWFDKVGNMAGAMGKDVNQAVEAVADAVSGGGLERLKEFGISANTLKDLGWSGDYSAQGIETLKTALSSLMEENYGGGMEKMMGTAKGAMSNFSDSIFQIKAAIGDALLPTIKAITPLLTQFANGLAALANNPAGQALIVVGTAIGGIMLAVGPLLIVLPSLVNGWQLLTAAMGAKGALGAISALRGVLPALIAKLGTLATTALPAAASAVSGLGSSFAGMAAAGGPIALVILAIAALAYELYKLAQKWLEAKKAAEDSVKAFERARDAETEAANARGAGEARARQLKEIQGAKATVGERIWGALTPGKTSKQMAQERVAAGQSSSLFETMRGTQRRAGGGPVAAGRLYLVGERGPELMIPQTAGNVVPTSRGLGRSQMPQIAQGGTTRQLIELRLAPGIIAREVSQAVQSPGVRQKIVSISQMTNAAAIPSTAY